MNDFTSSRIISSRHDFNDALRQAFAQAAGQGCREIFICDATFADWPLGERSVIESLSLWAYSHRKLTVLAQHFDEFHRRHARWVEWRRQWTHVVECRALAEGDEGRLPGLFLAPGLVVIRMLDAEHCRASISFEEGEGVRAREQLDALLQRSEEAFPASTLGL